MSFYPVMDSISELIITLYSMPKLTISAVSGAAAGLGFSLALATDHIIAEKTSKLAMNFIGIGLIPDGGAHFFLEKKLGEAKAKQVIWDGKMMDADEALELGLIEEVATGTLQETLDARIADWLMQTCSSNDKNKKNISRHESSIFTKNFRIRKTLPTKNA